MRHSLRTALLCAGLLATVIPMSAHAAPAAPAPTTKPSARVEHHKLQEAGNAAAIASARKALAEKRATSAKPKAANVVNDAAIAIVRKARAEKRLTADRANAAAIKAKRVRPVSTELRRASGPQA
jgi:hypothetical protein